MGSQHPTCVVFMLGYPGMGKRVVGEHLATLLDGVLADNQLINRPLLALFRWDDRGSGTTHERVRSLGDPTSSCSISSAHWRPGPLKGVALRTAMRPTQSIRRKPAGDRRRSDWRREAVLPRRDAARWVAERSAGGGRPSVMKAVVRGRGRERRRPSVGATSGTLPHTRLLHARCTIRV